MIQNFWLTSCIFLILAIMIHNPKSQSGVGQNQILNGTRSAEESLNRVTWGLVTVFFLLTTYLAAVNKLD